MLKSIQLVFLLPIAALWSIITRVRNFIYDVHLLKSHSFSSVSIIGIGNLSFGGTGKTPHVEYLVNLFLSQGYHVNELATLSRGYGRKSNGFMLVEDIHSTSQVGDEPLQFKHKFPDLVVAVDADRKRGIESIKNAFPTVRVILLDDAFQHRKISLDLSIILTDYSHLYVDDYLFPVGRLREPKIGAKRADIIIVTKGSKFISPLEQRSIRDKIDPAIHQKVFFSHMEYLPVKSLSGHDKDISIDQLISEKYSILLVTGIAKSLDLEYYLKENVYEFIHLKYPDHYSFSSEDIHFMKDKFARIQNSKKIILTTEKDSKRLLEKNLLGLLTGTSVFYIPIKITFAGKDEADFNKLILDYVRRNKVNSDILNK